MRTPQDHIAPRQQRIESALAKFSGNRLQRFDGEHGHGGVHVRRLAEEPVANDAFAGHNLNLLRVRRRNSCSTIACTTKVRMLARHEQMQNLDVVPVDRHVPKLAVPVPRRPCTDCSGATPNTETSLAVPGMMEQ